MINRKPQLAPDWGLMIEDLMRAGLTQAAIGKEMGLDLTDRMLGYYRAGVQPTFWRGDALLVVWCAKTGKRREDVPMVEVTKGHRVGRNREAANGPTMRSPLPQWPPVGAAANSAAVNANAGNSRTREPQQRGRKKAAA